LEIFVGLGNGINVYWRYHPFRFILKKINYICDVGVGYKKKKPLCEQVEKNCMHFLYSSST